MPEADLPVYFDGRIVAAEDAHLPLASRGVLYGLGFFETFRTSGGRPHLWRYHRRRLESACAVAGIEIPSAFLARDEALLPNVVAELLQTARQRDAVFRYTIVAGSGAAPSELLAVRPLPPAPLSAGVALRVLKLARDNGEFLPRPKSLNYANALLGADEVSRRAAAPGDEGLFLSRAGQFVVETPRQNLAWFAGEELRYADPALGAVAGTCLQWLLETSGHPATPRRAGVDELCAAEAVFVLNSVRGITPVREIWDADDRAVLRRLDSAVDPRVLAFIQRWADSLRATAAGK